jgi:hypothetical protein
MVSHKAIVVSRGSIFSIVEREIAHMLLKTLKDLLNPIPMPKICVAKWLDEELDLNFWNANWSTLLANAWRDHEAYNPDNFAVETIVRHIAEEAKGHDFLLAFVLDDFERPSQLVIDCFHGRDFVKREKLQPGSYDQDFVNDGKLTPHYKAIFAERTVFLAHPYLPSDENVVWVTMPETRWPPRERSVNEPDFPDISMPPWLSKLDPDFWDENWSKLLADAWGCHTTYLPYHSSLGQSLKNIATRLELSELLFAFVVNDLKSPRGIYIDCLRGDDLLRRGKYDDAICEAILLERNVFHAFKNLSPEEVQHLSARPPDPEVDKILQNWERGELQIS